MTVVQIESFDIATSSPIRLLTSAGFWSSLPRTTVGTPSARLLMVGDKIEHKDVARGFERVAVPESRLPLPVLAYRMQYEAFVRSLVQDIRYTSLYMVVDARGDESSLIRLLGSYGVEARSLTDPVPRPFITGENAWDHITTSDGMMWRLMCAKRKQSGSFYARSMHRLLSTDFPVWAALSVQTMPQAEAMSVLRLKDITARYAPRNGENNEAAQEADEVQDEVSRLRYEMNRVGASLHVVQLHVLFGGRTPDELDSRQAIVESASPCALRVVESPGDVAPQIFSAEPMIVGDGALLSTPGVALLDGSARSFKRRTVTEGVVIGVDGNNAPITINFFNRNNHSYNSIILGQTGAGKTFFVLGAMLRHLLLGIRLVIIDPQGNIDLSFLGDVLCHRSIIGTSEASVNVLDRTHDEIGTQVELSASMLAMLGIFHHSDTLARAVLDQAMMIVYKNAEAEGAGENQKRAMPLLSDLKNALDEIAATPDQIRDVVHTASLLSYKMIPYVTGSRAALFGKPTTVDFSLSHAVTIYDVSKLPKAQGKDGGLRSAMLAITVANINAGIRRLRASGDTDPILVFVDEMGVLMRDPVIANYISEEFKTSRSRGVGMMVIDQDLPSLLGPADESGLHHGEPMLANSAFNFIFLQKDSELARIRESFPALPDELVNMLPAIGQGSCIAILPNDLITMSYLPSLLERVVLSSRLDERQMAKEIMKKFIDEINSYGKKN